MRFFVALSVALTLTLASSTAPAALPADPDALTRANIEREVVRELNRIRRAKGLHALRTSTPLRAAALAHSRAMIRLGFIGHDSPDGTTFENRIRRFYSDRGWSTWSVAETLVVASARVKAREIVKAWIDSSSHRAIALSSAWREIGVGAIFASSGPGDFSELPTAIVTADYGTRSGKITS